MIVAKLLGQCKHEPLGGSSSEGARSNSSSSSSSDKLCGAGAVDCAKLIAAVALSESKKGAKQEKSHTRMEDSLCVQSGCH